MRQITPGAMLAVFIMALPISAVAADTVVTCKDPLGWTNYHHTGVLTKEKSGFVEDRITAGLTTLVRISQNEYDLFYTDGRQEIISSRHDGAAVKLLRKGKNDAAFLVVYPNSIEVYTFYKDASGSEKFDALISRGGDLPIHKSSVMTGDCSGLDLDLLR